MTSLEFKSQVTTLIDDLKSVCATFGLGNDGNEFKIITQLFLFKFMNDKFEFEFKKANPKYNKNDWFTEIEKLSPSEYEMLLLMLDVDTAKLMPQHLLSHLYQNQNAPDFAKYLDDTLNEIALKNVDLFSVQTAGGEKIKLFDRVTEFVSDGRDDFAKAIINKLITCNFQPIFNEKFDFFATIFEYLIKDYNNDSGGKYAEYYTPHAVAKIMASILAPVPVENVTCYDPSAGSGTLLMNIAHALGEQNCTIYSQDISQKSSNLLRLNLILNNLIHSIPNVVQGNTILNPFHKEDNLLDENDVITTLKKFDFIVSNPPFKLDFSDYRDQLADKNNNDRFFAGVPKVPAKAKDKMAIYSLFLQHIIFSLSPNGKAAVVVPTGFITAQSGIDKKIRQHLVDNKMLAGVISMPSNIFATTGTNVSIIFIDKNNHEDVVLIDASSLGKTVKDGKNQKTELTSEEEQYIINSFLNKTAIEEFAVVAKYNELKEKNYSLSAGQYFDIKIEYSDISHQEYLDKMKSFQDNLNALFSESKVLENKIQNNLKGLKYE